MSKDVIQITRWLVSSGPVRLVDAVNSRDRVNSSTSGWLPSLALLLVLASTPQSGVGQEYKRQRSLPMPAGEADLSQQFRMMQYMQELVRSQASQDPVDQLQNLDPKSLKDLDSRLTPEQMKSLEQLVENANMLKTLQEVAKQLGAEGNLADAPGDSLKEKLRNSGMPDDLLKRFTKNRPELEELLEDPNTMRRAQDLMRQLQNQNGDPANRGSNRFDTPGPQRRDGSPANGPTTPRKNSQLRSEDTQDSGPSTKEEEIPNPFEDLPADDNPGAEDGDSRSPTNPARAPQDARRPTGNDGNRTRLNPQPQGELETRPNGDPSSNDPSRIGDGLRNRSTQPRGEVAPDQPIRDPFQNPAGQDRPSQRQLPQDVSPSNTRPSTVPNSEALEQILRPEPRGERGTPNSGNPFPSRNGASGESVERGASNRTPDSGTENTDTNPLDWLKSFGAEKPGQSEQGLSQNPGGSQRELPSLGSNDQPSLRPNPSSDPGSLGGQDAGMGLDQQKIAEAMQRVPKMSELLEEAKRDPSSLPPLSVPNSSMDAFREWLGENKKGKKDTGILSRIKDSLPDRVRDELRKEGLEQALSDIVKGAKEQATDPNAKSRSDKAKTISELAQDARNSVRENSQRNAGSSPSANSTTSTSNSKKSGNNPTKSITEFFKSFTQVPEQGSERASAASSPTGGPSGNGASGGGSLPGAGSWIWLVAIGALVGCVAIWKIMMEKSEATQHREQVAKQLAKLTIRTRSDIVHAFHMLASAAGYGDQEIQQWWTHRRVASRLEEKSPGNAESVSALTQLYEIARYEPLEKELTADQLQRARAAMERLAPSW